MKKILVLIPAFNAEKTISSLIEQISAFIDKKDILVVDDGSKDTTFQIATNCGVQVLQHKKNKGKGEALKTGFEYAIMEGYSGVITL
ncbi:MAG: glycosyltransferase, partial [candidate division Zixibacteria bacterium]|nr:glycosyltransferase [candidate division Zixibacteria bacterium]